MLYLELLLLGVILICLLSIMYILWSKISKIYHNNLSYFDVLFIIIYPIEQIFFLFLYYFDNPINRGLWVSIIIVIICMTVTIDKFLLMKQNEKVIQVCTKAQTDIIEDQTDTIKQLLEKLKQRESEKKRLLFYIEKLKKK